MLFETMTENLSRTARRPTRKIYTGRKRKPLRRFATSDSSFGSIVPCFSWQGISNALPPAQIKGN